MQYHNGKPRTGGRRPGAGEVMAIETRHIVQGYVTKGRSQRLIPSDPLPVRNAMVARARAEKLYEMGRYAGIDAYTVTHDEEAGECSEPVFHVRLGRVPAVES